MYPGLIDQASSLKMLQLHTAEIKAGKLVNASEAMDKRIMSRWDWDYYDSEDEDYDEEDSHGSYKYEGEESKEDHWEVYDSANNEDKDEDRDGDEEEVEDEQHDDPVKCKVEIQSEAGMVAGGACDDHQGKAVNNISSSDSSKRILTMDGVDQLDDIDDIDENDMENRDMVFMRKFIRRLGWHRRGKI
ncbi:hypothetical protein BGZ81_011234 [Podila clonocystis]|nr:hypothetical protein BGZ81_011234 [Podila clonocystis]